MAKNVREVKFKDNDVDVVVTITTEEDGTSRFQAPAGYKMYPMDLDGIKNPSLYGYDRDVACRRKEAPQLHGASEGNNF